MIDLSPVHSANLILDGGLNETDAVSDAVWIFRTPTTLNMKVGLKVILTGGASSNNVYWSAGTAATFDANTVSEGNIFSGTAGITFAAGCTHNGRY